MDYCSSCRRHLNGALVCPGCGAYAPDIAPPTTIATRIPTAGTASREATCSGSWLDGDLPDEPTPSGPDEAPHTHPAADLDGPPAAPQGPSGPDEAPHTHPAADLDGPAAAPQGRAARRRQLARWKKNKRRAAVATTIALVGGGLTLAALDRQSADRAQAAAAPDNHSMGSADEQTTAEARPESAPPGTHPSPRTTRPAHARPTAAVPHRQTIAAAPRTAPWDTHLDAAAAPRPARTAAARQQAAAPVSGGTDDNSTGAGTGTTAQQPSAPAATPATDSGTNSGTPPTSPSPAATSPSQVCLLVVCLG
ncbi:hypothetical protein [Streptomyces sp. NPDC007905]|uniref:SCO2400 family protein n=1 Tax=Streptomyces sp. NPDC007905 TaxID=3364788 RepID=UPI0036EAECE9